MSDLEVLSWQALDEKCRNLEADAYGYALEQYLRDCKLADLDRIQRACERRRESDEHKAERQREEAIAAGVVLSGQEVWDEEHTQPTPDGLCAWLRKTRPDVIYARHGIRLWYVPTSQYLCNATAFDRAKRQIDLERQMRATLERVS